MFLHPSSMMHNDNPGLHFTAKLGYAVLFLFLFSGIVVGVIAVCSAIYKAFRRAYEKRKLAERRGVHVELEGITSKVSVQTLPPAYKSGKYGRGDALPVYEQQSPYTIHTTSTTQNTSTTHHSQIADGFQPIPTTLPPPPSHGAGFRTTAKRAISGFHKPTPTEWEIEEATRKFESFAELREKEVRKRRAEREREEQRVADARWRVEQKRKMFGYRDLTSRAR